MRYCHYITLFITLLTAPCFAQDESNSVSNSSVYAKNIKDYEKALIPFSKTMLKAPDNDLRDQANNAFTKLFTEALSLAESYTYPFDSLKNIKCLTSDDGELRIYTWTVPAVDGTSYKYYGFIQHLEKKNWFLSLFSKKRSFYTVKLRDALDEIPEPENCKLKPERWYGAWYYKLITNKYLGKTYYTVLGWRGNNRNTTIKVIDNISLADNKIVFGLPMFKNEKLTKNRELFEFSAGVSMSLHYESQKKIYNYGKTIRNKKTGKKTQEKIELKDMIVFDHLTAQSANFEGLRQYYGPDLSYDGYLFEKGKWIMYKQIEVVDTKMPTEQPKRKYASTKRIYAPVK